MFQKNLTQTKGRLFTSAFFRRLKEERHMNIYKNVNCIPSFREVLVLNRFNYKSNKQNNSILFRMRFENCIKALGL